MPAAMAAVRSAMLAGLGMAALALAGEPSSPVLASAAGQAPESVRGAGRAGEAGVGDGAGGGRDPFVRPMASGSSRSVEARPSGLSGLTVDAAVLRGVVSSRAGRFAVLEGPDARAYVARPGDRLRDGAVREVTGDGVLLLRDAAASVPFAERSVRKRLRGTESVR